MTGILRNLYHYPIKGLSAQALDAVSLRVGEGFPMDRMLGFARQGSGFDPTNPRPLPKSKFVVLAQDAGLATLRTTYDPEAAVLTIAGAGRRQFDLSTDTGSAAAARHLAEHLDYAPDAHPQLCAAAPHRFTDVSVVSANLMNAVSLINLDSVAALSAQVGQEVSAQRFRGNIVFSGLPAFSELDWVGRQIRIGEVTLKGVLRTKRCPATQVNLDTGTRDLDVPALLRKHYGHADMGIYCEVLTAGTIQPGDAIELL